MRCEEGKMNVSKLIFQNLVKDKFLTKMCFFLLLSWLQELSATVIPNWQFFVLKNYFNLIIWKWWLFDCFQMIVFEISNQLCFKVFLYRLFRYKNCTINLNKKLLKAFQLLILIQLISVTQIRRQSKNKNENKI